MTKFSIFELVLIQLPEVNKQLYFFNKYSSGALSSDLGHFGLSLSRFRETISIKKKKKKKKDRVSFTVEYMYVRDNMFVIEICSVS